MESGRFAEARALYADGTRLTGALHPGGPGVSGSHPPAGMQHRHAHETLGHETLGRALLLCACIYTHSLHRPAAPAESQNAFIWAAWAYLEARSGNAREARKLYDASTVADPEHAAAWHGWGLLEKQQGNLLAARDLWLKVLSFFLSPVSCLSSSLQTAV